MPSEIAVEIVARRNGALAPDLVSACERLVPQLAPHARTPTLEELQGIVDSPCTTLLVARADAGAGRIVGMLTLTQLRIPSGVRVTIEDVVVDEAARGAGVGEALTREALRLARARGATSVDLTSNPARESANRLYQRLGFTRRETNVYRFALGRDEGA
mgnify:CR=1 FL=1